MKRFFKMVIGTLILGMGLVLFSCANGDTGNSGGSEMGQDKYNITVDSTLPYAIVPEDYKQTAMMPVKIYFNNPPSSIKVYKASNNTETNLLVNGPNTNTWSDPAFNYYYVISMPSYDIKIKATN